MFIPRYMDDVGEDTGNVAWAGAYRTGGNLDSENERRLRKLLEAFGAALEKELKIREINIQIFPIFREFNLVAGITKSKVIFITSPSFGGMPFEIWMNWENEINDLNVQTIIDKFRLQVGWTSPSYLQFPKNVLEMETPEKNKLLTEKAINWIDSFHTEIDGKKMTLCNCVESQTSFNNGVFSTVYWVQVILVGIHLQNSEQIRFKSIAVELSLLDEWMGISGIEYSFDGNTKKISVNIPETYKTKVENDLSIELVPAHSIKFRRMTDENKPLDVSISQKYLVNLSFDVEKGFDDYFKTLNKFINFLTLMISQPISYLSIKGKHPANTIQNDGNTIYPEIVILPGLSKNPEPSSISPYNIFIPFDEIKKNIQQYVERWFILETKYESAIQLFFGSIINTQNYSFQTFSNLIQSLEVYHRMKYPDMLQFDKSEFESISKSIIDFVPDKFKEWITKVLEHSNNIILRKRLENLIKTNALLLKLFKNSDEIDSFIFKITETRHYYTHYSPEKEQNAATGIELFNINGKLGIILRILLTYGLGFNEEEIEKFVKNNSEYKEFLRRCF